MLTATGRFALGLFGQTGEILKLGGQSVALLPKLRRHPRQLVDQVSFVGAETVPITVVLSFFVGMVLALQSGYQLQKYGIEEKVGALVGLSIVKELGPVITAIILAARAGAAMATALGTMVVSEEVDALRSFGINPVEFLAVPRVLACLIALPLLVILADAVGMCGGALIAKSYIGISYHAYWDNLYANVNFKEIFNGVVKGTVFGFLIGAISCRAGLSSSGGADGVGRATTRAVVASLIAILICDYFITRFLIYFD
ncbi:MAG: hypothetical protein A3G34_00265 [Candidatus Lindowbacteria bacterium RIFCSPLOWO2_12_FULL_62_27]|nr:MAG: hypothetical protein A3G34_00265 [Candidatus Lindowbacteria bacterium RIFCSPLOWO2_12_FULL_62_27]OGH63382.1 MAG: hypothetical protein A3I06_08335 [Candidatus Lindowbacteria bacterium RIFCSPLOWO2_02_FULL_62_12]